MPTHKSLIAALDSSGPTLRVAVSDGNKIYTARRSGIKQENFFLPLLERVLQKAGGALPDIKQICFVRGPGRFTGIRISLTFASMMQALNNSRVYSATAFELLYKQLQHAVAFRRWQQKNPSGVAAIVLHAFREEYFLQFFDASNQGPMWLSRAELLAKLKQYPAPVYVTGTDKDGASLEVLLKDYAPLASPAAGRIRMQTILQLASDPQYEKNALEPLYLKPARFELGQ